MRIAICVSGQPRTWEKCVANWKEVFSSRGDVDYFFHLWDYNTLPSNLANTHNAIIEDQPVLVEEQQRIIDALAPKGHLFEPRKLIQYWNCTIPEMEQFGFWCRDQYYSMYRAALLKRDYEIKNNFEYDVVIRLRADLRFIDAPSLNNIRPNTVYTCHNCWDEQYNCYRVGDIFYYSNSHTFDTASGFYKYLSFASTKLVVSGDTTPPPEMALYNYFAGMGITNHATSLRIRAVRPQEHYDIVGTLNPHETI